MGIRVVYILGLFDDLNNQLFINVGNFLRENGCDCQGVELYQNAQFGAYSFQKEIERIQKTIDKLNPTLIIGHSLGGYLALHLKTSCSILLLEPSLSISNIFLPNFKKENDEFYYEDGETRLKISHEFVESLEQSFSIEKLSKISKVRKICVVGAGLAGYKVAEQYHTLFPSSSYKFIPEAEHSFLNTRSVREIIDTILLDGVN